jgi:regulator of cell morphogenesis and NO signaling
MSPIDPTSTLGALVAERPERAPLFERLHLDYCCGGSQTLSQACARRGLDVDTVSAVIEAIDADGRGERGFEETDWRGASLEELCAHIVAVHHARLRDELPRIAELLATTVRVHASSHPALHDLQRCFNAIRARLEPHLDNEEEVLFPQCVALECDGAPLEDALIDAHAGEHADVGEQLALLRELGGDYERDRAYCGTHRALLEALSAFERDLHQHIHEENNVLFARARELGASARSGRGAAQGLEP